MGQLVAARLDTRAFQMLQAISVAQDRTISYLVRKAVQQYLESQSREEQRIFTAQARRK